MVRRSLRCDCSGQVLIVSALLVALLLLSTALYVIDVGKDVSTVDPKSSVDFGSYRGSVKNTLVSALANISGGGDHAVLASDLAALKAVICEHSYSSLLSMDYSLPDGGVYSGGVWLSWGSLGVGVSGVYSSFTFNSSGYNSVCTAAYSVNVTSAVHVNGSYIQLNESLWQVNLSLAVSDEAGAALAQNLTLRFQNGTDWLSADSPFIVDHGDGTYAASFNVEGSLASEPLVASVACLDMRGILVCANVTCNRMT